MFRKINILKIFRNLKTYKAKSLKKKSEAVIFGEWIYTQVVFRILLSLKKPFLKNNSEWLLPSNLQHSLVEHLVASSLFQFLMISSEFTEHFPGSNEVHYPISDGKDFTLVLTSVVGRQNYINVWCINICFSLKMFFITGDKSAGIFGGLVKISEWNS